MDAATKYQVYTYSSIASNGGTRIFQSKESVSPLTPLIKVTPDIGRAKTKTKYWVSEKEFDGTYGQPSTGMFSTSQRRWFYGDLEDKKHLIVFEFRQDKEVLRTYYFENFYPKNPKRFVTKFIKQ